MPQINGGQAMFVGLAVILPVAAACGETNDAVPTRVVEATTVVSTASLPLSPTAVSVDATAPVPWQTVTTPAIALPTSSVGVNPVTAATPIRTPTPTLAAAQILTPVATLTPVSALTFTATPEARPTPVPTVTPAPTSTPTPTFTPTATPAPTATPSPTPRVAGVSRDYPASAGASVTTTDGLTVTVISFNPDAWPLVQAENQFNDAPSEGNRDIIIRLRVQNTGGSTNEEIGVLESDFKLVGSYSTIYSPFQHSCGTIPDELEASLFLGGTSEGNVCFQVPAEDSDHIIFYDGFISFDTNDRRWIRLASSTD